MASTRKVHDMLRKTSLLLVVGLVSASALAQPTYDYEVNISGATLFRNFFTAPASTNDWIDVNGDGVIGFDPFRVPVVDQLAPLYPTSGWWLVQYRGVGSVNGLGEFVDYQLLGAFPDDNPSEVGVANRYVWSEDGEDSGALPACDPNGSNTPICPASIDLAVLDVPGAYGVVAGDPNDAAWSLNPTASGYGHSPILSWDTSYKTNLESLSRDDGRAIVSLNTNTASPDASTIYDTPIAWVPIAFITNRGSGLEDVCVTELQHLYVTGRLSNGENYVASNRDVGSGTRNGAMNSIGVDPSWGRGDNLGSKNKVTALTVLGPNHQATNNGGSSVMEGAVQQRRLAVGYTGLAGGSRAVADMLGGKYEILNVKFDDRGGSDFVRPTIDSVLDNCDPNSGYQVGGAETFVSVGSSLIASGQPGSMYPAQIGPADYLNNILDSIDSFIGNPPADQNFNMPGEYLATTYFLLAGMDCLPNGNFPTDFIGNSPNQTLQDFIRANNDLGVGQDTPDFGTVNEAGLVPTREELSLPDTYGDGSTGNFLDFDGNATVLGGSPLNKRNRIAGDFDGDYDRDGDDIDDMLTAFADPRAFVTAQGNGVDGFVIPELIGDFDGDGNFTMADIRYFADGLTVNAMGNVDRGMGFTLVDQAFGGNFFGTTLATTCATYSDGDSRGDVAGGALVAPGAQPMGADGVVDATDIEYVFANFGDWSDLDQAVYMDLSCDMNGDLMVDAADIAAIVEDILETHLGDVDFDCDVDFDDLNILLATYGQTDTGYTGGDLDGDGDTDFDDLNILLANYGS